MLTQSVISRGFEFCLLYFTFRSRWKSPLKQKPTGNRTLTRESYTRLLIETSKDSGSIHFTFFSFILLFFVQNSNSKRNKHQNQTLLNGQWFDWADDDELYSSSFIHWKHEMKWNKKPFETIHMLSANVWFRPYYSEMKYINQTRHNTHTFNGFMTECKTRSNHTVVCMCERTHVNTPQICEYERLMMSGFVGICHHSITVAGAAAQQQH